MSYFSLSPSSVILSHQSKVQSINNFENFVRTKRERDKTIDTKQVKEFRIIGKFLQKYEIYVQLLLGRSLKNKDQNILNQKWVDNVGSFSDQMLPDAILRFPNPDFKHCDSYDTMTALEAMLFIEKILKLDRNNIEIKIFFKAIEGVLINLDQNKIIKVRAAFTQNSQLKATHQDLYLLENVHQQISENNEPIYETFQRKQSDNKNQNPLKVDILNKLISNFKQALNKKDQNSNIRQKLIELLDIDYNMLKRVTPKKMKNGGFLNFSDGAWSRTQLDTADFLTLMRNIIVVQLMLMGYNIQNSISEDGKYIFCKLYANEDNLKTMAEKQKMKKKLNFCFSDLFSLEPVDNSFRPLRLNNRLWKPDDYNDLSDMFLYLRPKIIKLIQDINFKRVAREVNQSRISNQLFQYGKMDIQDDDEHPTDLQWYAYYQYLVHLEKELNSIRIKNIINSDIAALINKQLTPYELYIIRNNKNDQVKILTKQNIKDKQNWYHQQEVKKIQENVFQVIQEYSRFFQITDKVTTKLLKLFRQERLAQKYFKIFEEALKVANTDDKILYNFWDLIHFERLDSYVNFTKPTKTCSTTMKYQSMMCWCKYQVNEEKKISLFSSSERLKLVEQSINSLFQMNDLISKKIVISLFCVNDHYELFGHQTIKQQELLEEDFYRKKLYHLEFEWSFNIIKPWSTPINQICEYYGEKIGLYFYYTTYYTQMLLKIAFIALGCNLIQWVIQDSKSDLYYLLRIIFAFLQIQWTNLFVVLWQKKQLIFNIQFGQSGKEEIQKQRSNFNGSYLRSIENDQMNSIGINQFELFTRMFFATSTLLFIIGSYAAIMIGLYVLTTTLKAQFQDNKTLESGFFEILVTASINIVIIQFLDKVYDIIAMHLTDFENQKSVKDYEESFIVKKYILYFVSYVGPLIVIAFLNGPFDLYCKQTNCSDHVQYHFATMIIWIFVFKTFKIIKLLYQVKKIPIFKYTFDDIDIDRYVEEQSNRQSYAKSQERYGTLEDYMEIFLQNTLLSIFGYTFPFSFFLLWIQNIGQMQADKAKFIYYLQRPWPQNNSSLGVWNSILELINYVCILTNTGQMIIDYSLKFGDELILVYLTFLISNFMMNFVLNGIFGQIPFELGLFLKRQKYLIKSTIEQFQKTKSKAQIKSQENLKKFPLFKIFGSSNIKIKGEFETISSEDELFDHFDINYMEKFCNISQKEKQKSNKGKEINQLRSAKVIENQQLKSTKNLEINQRLAQQSYQKLPIESIQKISFGSFQRIQESKQVLSFGFDDQHIKQKIMKEDKENKKEQKQVVNRQISSLIDQVMSQQSIQKYFQRRKINYIFEIKKWKRFEKKKLFSAQEFLYQKILLNTHKLIWSDLRIAYRYVYMRRKTLYFRNFDFRKLKVLKKNQRAIQEQCQEKAKNKFRKEFKLLQNSKKNKSQINNKEDLEELSHLRLKQKTYINKHTWLNSRKVLLLKIKGVWFSQYRRQYQREPSFKIALDFLSKAKLIEKIKGETDLKEKLSKSLGDPSKIQFLGLDTLIQGYLSLQYNSKEKYDIPLSTRQLNIIDYYINKKKSDIFTFIVDGFRDTFIFDHQYQKLQQFSMQYFEEELFPIENFKLIRQLNNTTWISQDKSGKKFLIQFLQIRHEQQFKNQKYNFETYGVSYLQGELNIRLSNLVDQVDDFYIKGYCVIKYNIFSQITLKQVIKYRQVHGIQYKLDELYEFLHACLQIIKIQKCGDINLSSFVFHQRTYILFRSNHNDDDDLINLAQVLIEMILLKPVPDALTGFAKISINHPLKTILQQMIYEDIQLDDLINRIPLTSSFVEINIEEEIKIKERNNNEDSKDFLVLSTHQINLNFRMKQFKEALQEIQNIEKQLSNNQFTSATSIEQGFYKYFFTNQYKILTSHSDISFTFNVLLIIYIKFSTSLQMKFNFIKDLEILYHALMRSVESLDDLLKQLSLNVKLEQLTNIEQKIMLRRKLTRSNSQIDLQSKDRLQLIKDIRKNPTHIKIITKVKKELQRYCLQFQVLHSLYLYFNQDFVYSAQILEDIQNTQTSIIQSETKIIQIVEEPDDLTPNQFNFNQQSPTLDAALQNAQEENFQIQKEFDDSPNYCLQLLYYKYLQLIVWFDGGKETFHNNYIDFLQEKVHSPVYEYFSAQLKIIQRYEIPKEYIDFNQQCEIGKYIVISMNKWIEQSYFIPSKLEYFDNFQLMWKQLISYSVLEQSLENRQILVKLLNQKEQTLPSLLLELRAIHQILHLDNYVPIHKYLDPKNINTNNLNGNFVNNSLIKRLQKLHNDVSIESDSWFHSKGLLQFRLFYILSLFFTFSRKHFENMMEEDSNLLFLAEMALKQTSCQSETDAKRVKASQIRMKTFDIKELKSDPKPNQVNSILSSYFYIRNFIDTESNEEDDLKQLIEKYNDQLKPSLIVLAIIQYYIAIDRKDLADIIILQTFKLIEYNVGLFDHAHSSFKDDLLLFQIKVNEDKLLHLEPFDRLFKRKSDIGSLSQDNLLNLQYLIYNQFFHLDIQFNIDILEDQLKNFNLLPPYYDKLKSIYQLYLLYLNATLGNINLEEIEKFIQIEFKQNTAYSAIIKNILVRYYLNMQDYELALPLIQNILDYLYSLKIQTHFVLKQIDESSYVIENNVNFISQIVDVNQIEIHSEDTDHQYFHIIDTQFIQENLIHYIDIITNLQNKNQYYPQIHEIFKLLFDISETTTQNNMFKVLSQLFLCYSKPEYIHSIFNQVYKNQERQLLVYLNQRNSLKEKMSQLIMINELSEEDNAKYTLQINVLNYFISIYESVSKGITQKTILSWSIQAAEKAIVGLRIQGKNFQSSNHYLFSQLFLQLSDCFVRLGQISTALIHIDQAEEELLEWFNQDKHPLKGYFFMKQGLLRPLLTELFTNYTDLIMQLDQINRLQIYDIIRALFQFNKKILKIFENSQDIQQLEQSLLLYVKSLDQDEKITVDIFKMYQGNEPLQLMKQVMKISPYDMTGVNILIDAQSIFQHFNQNNQFTKIVLTKIEEFI